MQGEAALVAADVEGAANCSQAPRPLPRGCVVGALIEKRAGLLSGVGVVVKSQAVQMKLGGRGGTRRIGQP